MFRHCVLLPHSFLWLMPENLHSSFFLMQLSLRCFASFCVFQNPTISISFGMLLVTVISIIKVHSSRKRKHQSAPFSGRSHGTVHFSLMSNVVNVSLIPSGSLLDTLCAQFSEALHALQCLNPRIEGPYSVPSV